MASVFSTNINLEEPGLGDYFNGWNVPVNSNFTIIDNAVGGEASYSLAGGNVTLTVAQSAYYLINLTGTLTGSTSLFFPSTIGGRKYINNACAGGYSVTVHNGAGDTGGVIVPNGLITPVILTQAQAYYDNYQSVPPGTILSYAGVTAPPGWLLTIGTSLSTTGYPLLFAAIAYTYGGSGSSFLIPDTRGYVLAGADNMGGTPAGILPGYSLATTGGQHQHTLITSEMPTHNHTDSGHTHAITDPGHLHSGSWVLPGANGLSGTGIVGNPSAGMGSATTGITVNSGTANIQNTGGGTAHNNVQPTFAINHIIRF